MAVQYDGATSDEDRQYARPDNLDLVGLYFSDVGHLPLLSAEDEVHLAQLIEAGRAAKSALVRDVVDRGERIELQRKVDHGNQARSNFVRANLRLVISIARRGRRQGLSLLDAVQDGNVGLCHAVDRFDWHLGVRFSTYATPWIAHAIATSGRDAASQIHIPRARRRQFALVADTADRLEHQTGSRPGLVQLSEATGVPIDDIACLRRAINPMAALQSRTSDQFQDLTEVIPDTAVGVDDAVVARCASQELEPLLDQLPSSGARVLRLRYGIGSGNPLTAKQVASVLSLSAERVSQLERRALLQLQHHVRTRGAA